MGGVAQDRVSIRLWITPEASMALDKAADKAGVVRSRYLQNVIGRILFEHRPELDVAELLPPPRRHSWLSKHGTPRGLGYKGRWAKWTRAACVADPSLPYILTKIAQSTGDISMSSLIRRYLAEALHNDLGVVVPMPNSAAGHFAERGMR